MINILKSNSSIQEVSEEEIITDNSLKKSCSLIKNNSNSLNVNNEENKIKKDNSKKHILKQNIISLLSDKTNITNNSNKKFEPKCICQKREDKNKKIKNDITKSKNNEDDKGKNTLKDYSLEDHLENESVENFPPTQHTTKIEQKSQNSYTLNQKNHCDIHNKRNNFKNKKIQLNNLNNNSNSNIIKYNKINKRQNYFLYLNKNRKAKNKVNDINNNDMKNIFLLNNRKNITKNNSKSRNRSKKNLKIDTDKYFINNYNHINNNNKKPKSSEKIKNKINTKIDFRDYKKQEISKQINNNFNYKNKYDKIITNINEINNKHLSNYHDYFIKTKNINTTIARKEIIHKYKSSYSINKYSNRTNRNNKFKSISQNKSKKNIFKKILFNNKTKNDKK